MRYKWTESQIDYLTKPIPKVERSYFWEWVIIIVIVVMTIIKFG